MFFRFVVRYCWFSWIIVCLKLRIKARGWIPIVFKHFWEKSKFDQIWTPWTPYLLPEYFKTIQEKTNACLKHIILHIPTFLNSNILNNLENPGDANIENCFWGFQNNLQSRWVWIQTKIGWWNLDKSLKSRNLQNISKSY